MCTNNKDDNERDEDCTDEKPRCTGLKSGDTGEQLPNEPNGEKGNECKAPVLCKNTEKDNKKDDGCSKTRPRCITFGASGETSDIGSVLPNVADSEAGDGCVMEVKCFDTQPKGEKDAGCTDGLPNCVGGGSDNNGSGNTGELCI